MKVRAIKASPYFGKEGNFQVAYMDANGRVSLTSVELVHNDFNEGLTIGPFTPSQKLVDVYGAKNMETIGQCQTHEVQNELIVVGVRNPVNGKAPTIWIKHYKEGIMTVDEPDDSEEDDEDDSDSGCGGAGGDGGGGNGGDDGSGGTGGSGEIVVQ